MQNLKNKMRTRLEILKDLVHLNKNLLDLQTELSQFSWDLEKPIFLISKDHICNVLQKHISDLSYKELEDWANLIECRDDLGFESDPLKEIIFELANPEINGEITQERLKEMILELS